MSKIQELLKGRDDQIDYAAIAKEFPWVREAGHKCILSPDSDGLLCGLFMSYYLNWSIKGFYDGKVMLLEKGISAKDCIFLDMEIYRENIRSIGHHMLLFNKNKKLKSWSNFKNCIQPNTMRDYDAYQNFRLKYPLATIHLLIGIIGSTGISINIPDSSICPLLFTDGTYNVLFKYPENVLNWLHYLRANEETNSLKQIFENEKYSVYTLMLAMDDFFKKRDEISMPNERGDRLRISDTEGIPCNILKRDSFYDITLGARDRIIRFLNILAELTTWGYKEKSWTWQGLELYEFTKEDLSGKKLRLNNKNFEDVLAKKPISWAITTNQNLEFTVERPSKLYG